MTDALIPAQLTDALNGAAGDLTAALPWLTMLVTVALMAVIVLRQQSAAKREERIAARLIDALDRALERQQTAHAPAPAPAPVPAPPPAPRPAPLPAPAPAPAPKPAPAPAPPAGEFAGAPPWFQWALKEIGTAEIGSTNTGPAIDRYVRLAKCGAAGEPWCAIFANAALESVGITGTRSAAAQSFRNNPGFVPISAPTLGAIAVFWRNSPGSGQGHVGFYRGELGDHVWVLGGNENNMVQIEALPKSAGNFGLIGYWWPKSVPLPASGPVIMPQGSPTHVQSPPGASSQPAPAPAPSARMTNITATVFGGPDDPQMSAYTGQPVDPSKPGCALPYRFATITPEVIVTNATTRQQVRCQVVDVGPWNTHDPYWLTAGARPQAESGTDSTGRPTNHAGIDLTPAAAAAIGIAGKGLVDWEFATDPVAVV